MKDMAVIVNLYSGKGIARRGISDMLDVFCAAGYLPRVHVTQSTEDAKRMAYELGKETRLLVAVGGDGTLNNVVSGTALLSHRPLLGYIPAGSTNDFARSLELPSDVREAAQTVMFGVSRKLDMGRFNDDEYFMYVAGFGAFTEVSYRTPQDKKNILGHQAYLLEAVKSLASIKAIHMRVEWEEGSVEGDFIFGMVSSTTSVGGLRGIVPRDVSLSDGLFEVLLIRMPKAPADLPNIVSYLFFKEEENEYVIRFKTGKVRFVSEEETAWTLDGEFGGLKREVVIENLKEELLFVTKGQKPQEKC